MSNGFRVKLMRKALQTIMILLAILSASPGWSADDKAEAFLNAIKDGKADAVESLLAGGVDLQAKHGARGETLWAAAAETSLDYFKLALEVQADAEPVSGEGLAEGDPLRNNLYIFKLLLSRSPGVFDKNVFVYRLFKQAINVESLQSIRKFADNGLDVNARNEDGSIPLRYAVDKGNVEIVTLLLTKGAAINSVSIYGTALMDAILADNREIIELLIAKGADVNVSGAFGSPLLLAVLQNKTETVRLLLARGANPDLKPVLGITATGEARRLGNREILDLLAGAAAPGPLDRQPFVVRR